MKLCDMNLGDKSYVTCISPDLGIARRLLDIGVIPGTKVECVLLGPMGNPKAYMIRGAVIAIRNEDAYGVSIEDVKEG